MRDRKYLWIALFFIGLAIICFLMVDCKSKGCFLKLADEVIFITHDNGQTEILLICLNLTDQYVLRISADVTVKHMQTDEIFDCINVWVGDIEPQGMKRFSAWTDKLTFGDDVGVMAEFFY